MAWLKIVILKLKMLDMRCSGKLNMLRLCTDYFYGVDKAADSKENRIIYV